MYVGLSGYVVGGVVYGLLYVGDVGPSGRFSVGLVLGAAVVVAVLAGSGGL